MSRILRGNNSADDSPPLASQENSGDSQGNLFSSRVSEEYSQSRPVSRTTKLLIGGCVLVLGIVGIILGVTQPWKKDDDNDSSIKVFQPPSNLTRSPSPSFAPSISKAPNYTRKPTRTPSIPPEPTDSAKAAMYQAVSGFIMDLGISEVNTFRRFATDNDNGTGDKDTPQQKAVNHIAQNDMIFQDWAFKKIPPPRQRIAQRYVITLMYFALGGDQWTNDGMWLSGEQDECTWYGLTCEEITVYATKSVDDFDQDLAPRAVTPRVSLGSQQDIVTEIRLKDNNLIGTLPLEMLEFKNLKILGLYNNQISGPLPEEIYQINTLTKLWLNNNKITGTLSSDIRTLSKLDDLSIAANQFTGSIPSEIGKLTDLTRIQAFENQFFGSIPSEIGLCTGISRLFFDQNKLSGPLPYTIGSLTKLYDFRIFKNRFQGVLPDSLSKLSDLKIFYADNNEFEGPISASIISGLKKITQLEIFNNQISDPIPTEIGLLTSLQKLDLRNNKIKGKLPDELCSGGNLKKLVLGGNDITGSFPETIRKCNQLTKLHLNNNALDGNIPAWISELSKLSSLHLQYNNFNGEVPVPKFLGMSALKELKLEYNNLTGKVDSICSGKSELTADCSGLSPEIICDCCTKCY